MNETNQPEFRTPVRNCFRVSEKALQLLRAAVKRRNRSRSWAYALWLLAWLPPLVWMAGDLSFHVSPFQLAPLLIPIVVLLAQLAYPTLLGWAALLIPSIFFTGVMLVFVVFTAPGRIRDNLPAFAISSVAVGFYLLVCIALWRARPKPWPTVDAPPSASQSGDSVSTKKHTHLEKERKP